MYIATTILQVPPAKVHKIMALYSNVCLVVVAFTQAMCGEVGTAVDAVFYSREASWTSFTLYTCD